MGGGDQALEEWPYPRLVEACEVGRQVVPGFGQAPTQPLDGATGFYRTGTVSFYISTRLIGRPSSRDGWVSRSLRLCVKCTEGLRHSESLSHED